MHEVGQQWNEKENKIRQRRVKKKKERQISNIFWNTIKTSLAVDKYENEKGLGQVI